MSQCLVHPYQPPSPTVVQASGEEDDDDDDLEANHGSNKGEEGALGANVEHIIPDTGDNVSVYNLPHLTRHIYFNINSSSHQSEHQAEPQSQGKISPPPPLNLWDQALAILCTLLEAELLSA
ncbi:hypothetical protein L2E82_05039 [Cichorium intybus]|uniref:Uncharacterized protein n=1 Tax=Cichorium intybus TaxID=13427 RepID=A0ACB9H612_CICIN|nr:hypothetical protein L2E82_05039 [Cichorium intybus]